MIRDINDDVIEVKNDLYEFRKDMTRRVSKIETHLEEHNKALTTLQIDVGILKEKVAKIEANTESSSKELSEMKGDIKALSAEIRASQTKTGWYITLMGIGISVVLWLIQTFVK